MKVMISQPMRGKTEEKIRCERAKLVKKLEKQGYEVVDTIFQDSINQGNISLKYLAKSIDYLAEVDAAYFMKGWQEARGCMIEHQCCLYYGVKIIKD
jgi:Asp-tRNA(Asn)/Glu-tRNA(Gln) amidotransferase A subunit family amidase